MQEMLRECREMSNGLMTAVLLVTPNDEANAGYQAALAFEREMRKASMHEDDVVVIHRQDHGTGNGYCVTIEKGEGGFDHWQWDENGRLVS